MKAQGLGTPRNVEPTNSLLVSEFSVRKLVKILQGFNEEELKKQRAENEKTLFHLSDQVRPISKQNWELEQEISGVEVQIKEVVKMRVKLDGRKEKKKKKEKEENENFVRPFDGPINKRPLFEEMFTILMHEPRYLAILAHECKLADIDDFVKTVLVDMYGGRPEFEAIMLRMFFIIMEMEFEKNQRDRTTIFRATSAASRLLRKYGEGEGNGILNQMIAKPIKDLVEANPNLEVGMSKMYKQFIRDFESHTGKVWPEEREGLKDEDVFKKPYIQKIYRPRIQILERVAENVFNCVDRNVGELPWGIRWVCKQRAELSQKYFPDISPYQRGGMVGGYLFLRLLCPRLTMPHKFNVIHEPPKKHTMKALQQTSTIIQKLANGVEFNETKVDLYPLNDFLRSKREDFQNLVFKLTDVAGLEHRMQMYKLLNQKQQRAITITTSYNQLILLHRLLRAHREKCCPTPDDPLLPVLLRLGTPITQQIKEGKNWVIVGGPYPDKPKATKYKPRDNRDVVLYLKPQAAVKEEDNLSPHSQAAKEVSTLDLFSGTREQPINAVIKSMLEFCKSVNIEDYPDDLTKGHDFQQFLHYVVQKNKKSASLAQTCIYDLEHCQHYLQMEKNEIYNPRQLIISFSEQIRVYRSGIKRLVKHVRNVRSALNAISNHHKFLLTKRNDWNDYLKNISAGNANLVDNLQRANAVDKLVLSHDEMRDKGMIIYFDPKYESRARKMVTYTFDRIRAGNYSLTVNAKKMGMTLLNEHVSISMVQLLQMQSKDRDKWQINEMLTLNVNLLKLFLCQTFKDSAK